MRSPTRARAAVVLITSLVIGLGVQPFRQLAWTDPVGTLAYAGAAVGMVALLLPHRGVALPGAIGTGLACAVELSQLTGAPAALAERFPPIALLLGSSFDPVDLLLLIAGGTVAALALSVTSAPPATGLRGPSDPLRCQRPDGALFPHEGNLRRCPGVKPCRLNRADSTTRQRTRRGARIHEERRIFGSSSGGFARIVSPSLNSAGPRER